MPKRNPTKIEMAAMQASLDQEWGSAREFLVNADSEFVAKFFDAVDDPAFLVEWMRHDERVACLVARLASVALYQAAANLGHGLTEEDDS